MCVLGKGAGRHFGIQGGLTEKVVFKSRPERKERVSHAGIGAKSI